MRVKLSKRAEKAVRRIDARWHADADHPDTFLSEMEQAIEFLETVSAPGSPSPTKRHPLLKRILLEKSRCHVYFEVNKRAELIDVIAVWDGRRERPPKL